MAKRDAVMSRMQAVVVRNAEMLNKIGMTALVVMWVAGLVEELVHMGCSLCALCTSLF
jgi:hypothetical protein